MGEFSVDVWKISSLADRFAERAEDYRELFEFYRDNLDQGDLSELAEDYDMSFSESLEYRREVMQKLGRLTDEVQELAEEAYNARQEFKAGRYSSGGKSLTGNLDCAENAFQKIGNTMDELECFMEESDPPLEFSLELDRSYLEIKRSLGDVEMSEQRKEKLDRELEELANRADENSADELEIFEDDEYGA